MYWIGIDIGGTTVKCGLFADENGEPDTWELPTLRGAGDEILVSIAESIGQVIQSRQMDRRQIGGIGVGVPGLVRRDGLVVRAVNLGWENKRAGDILEHLTDLPVVLGNDAHLAALGETWKGAAHGSNNVILVTLGTGLGCGIVLNGDLLYGQHGAGGELGHIVMHSRETLECACGNHGCLEQYTSATGLVRMMREEYRKSKKNTPSPDMVTAKKIFDEYRQGDETAGKVVGRFADELGHALATAAAILDPEIILLGGGVSRAGDVLLDAVHTAYQRYALSVLRKTPIRIAALGNSAGIYGAARLCQLSHYI